MNLKKRTILKYLRLGAAAKGDHRRHFLMLFDVLIDVMADNIHPLRRDDFRRLCRQLLTDTALEEDDRGMEFLSWCREILVRVLEVAAEDQKRASEVDAFLRVIGKSPGDPLLLDYRAVLASMDRDQLDVLVRKHLLGETWPEISESLAISVQSARTLEKKGSMAIKKAIPWRARMFRSP